MSKLIWLIFVVTFAFMLEECELAYSATSMYNIEIAGLQRVPTLEDIDIILGKLDKEFDDFQPNRTNVWTELRENKVDKLANLCAITMYPSIIPDYVRNCFTQNILKDEPQATRLLTLGGQWLIDVLVCHCQYIPNGGFGGDFDPPFYLTSYTDTAYFKLQTYDVWGLGENYKISDIMYNIPPYESIPAIRNYYDLYV